MNKTTIIAAISVAMLYCSPVFSYTTVDFSELIHNNPSKFRVMPSSVSSGGLIFDDGPTDYGVTAFLVYSANALYNADPGGATLTQNYGAPVMVTLDGGGLFDLVSIDLAHAFRDFASGYVDFTFVDSTGSSTATFNFDASTSALQTFMVNRTGLLSFSYNTDHAGGFGDTFVQIDNVVYGPNMASPVAVLEPATWMLMVGGFGLMGAGLRRQKASVRFA